ncbi:hypothetical protein ACFWR9_29865 [Streptomyces sp. NPDC058534]|uniref:hypothetical protein n=1 Tax=Streptomyces sp. NPDC058534 TaxID=3346541 RepID=UPI00365F0BBF
MGSLADALLDGSDPDELDGHELPDEAAVTVMAGSINCDTVCSATLGPVPTFEFLNRHGRQGGYAARLLTWGAGV